MVKLSIFVRSGYVHLPSTAGTLRRTSYHAAYWSLHAAATNAYALEFDTAINPSVENNRWYGFPLRCLSTVLDM